MCVVFGIVYIDQTALNVALPTIKAEFASNDTQLFWIINAYILPLAICGLAAGRLGDIVGLRKMFLLGLGIFMLASVGCALAFSPWFLIMFRALQGVGGAIIPVVTAASVYHLFPEGKRGKPMGIVGFMASISILVGPIIGGLLIKYGSWRWIFWINPILGISCFILVYSLLKHLDQEKDQKTTFDYVGLSLFLAFLVPIITALMQGENWGWSSPAIIILFCVGSLFLPLFVIYERKIKHPLLDFTLLKNPNIAISCIIFFCAQFAFIANVFTAMFLIRSLGKTPFQAGLCLMPSALISCIVNPIAGGLTDKLGYRKQIQIGLAGTTIAYLFIAITAHTMSYFWLLIGLVMLGVFMPLFFMAVYSMTIHSAPKHQQGMSSGMSSTLRQVGAAFSMSILGIIVIVFERANFGIKNAATTYALGYSNAIGLVALMVSIAFISSIWIDRKKAKYKAFEESKIPQEPEETEISLEPEV